MLPTNPAEIERRRRRSGDRRRRSDRTRRVRRCRLLLPALALALLPVASVAGAHDEGAEGDVVVGSVLPDSPAEAAGLREGDRLVALDSAAIDGLAALRGALAPRRPGDTVPLVVERDGEMLELSVTLGERDGGGASLGVALEIVGPVPAEGDTVTRAECVEWTRATYRVEALARASGLDLAERIAELAACVEQDVQALPPTMPRGWCDNSFKIHCSGLDVLTAIGEAQIETCEELLGAPLGSCAENRVFDHYVVGGTPSDESACREAVEACAAGAAGDGA